MKVKTIQNLHRYTFRKKLFSHFYITLQLIDQDCHKLTLTYLSQLAFSALGQLELSPFTEFATPSSCLGIFKFQ